MHFALLDVKVALSRASKYRKRRNGSKRARTFFESSVCFFCYKTMRIFFKKNEEWLTSAAMAHCERPFYMQPDNPTKFKDWACLFSVRRYSQSDYFIKDSTESEGLLRFFLLNAGGVDILISGWTANLNEIVVYNKLPAQNVLLLLQFLIFAV